MIGSTFIYCIIHYMYVYLLSECNAQFNWLRKLFDSCLTCVTTTYVKSTWIHLKKKTFFFLFCKTLIVIYEDNSFYFCALVTENWITKQLHPYRYFKIFLFVWNILVCANPEFFPEVGGGGSRDLFSIYYRYYVNFLCLHGVTRGVVGGGGWNPMARSAHNLGFFFFLFY